jgi:tetratricopeptide (TPR) repeat protein
MPVSTAAISLLSQSKPVPVDLDRSSRSAVDHGVPPPTETSPSKDTTDVDYIALPLAAAYHQRASKAWAKGDGIAALRDAERALELDRDWLPYETTRAVLLDTFGRGKEARRSLGRALTRMEASSQKRPGISQKRPPSSSEFARAYATRGMIALRCGEPAKAARDLRRAMELHPIALYTHSMGAALYALGDFEGAAGADARAVELSPTNIRYRWALVESLRQLGREREALAQGEAIIALEPEVASHRERLAFFSRPKTHGRQEQ